MYEGLVCVCCLASEAEHLLDLFPQEPGSDDYSHLLQNIFHIQVSRLEGHSHVCIACAARLKDVAEFKKQIHTTLSLLSSQFLHCSPTNNDKLILAKQENKTDSTKIKINRSSKIISNDKTKTEPATDEPKRPKKRGRPPKKAPGKSYGNKSGDTDGGISTKVKVSEIFSSDDEGLKQDMKKVFEAKTIYVVPEIGVRLRKSHVRPTPNRDPIILNERNIYPSYKLGPGDVCCRECPQQFNNLHSLQRHMNRHFPNYGCRHCDKAFMTMDGWKRHQRTHNRGTFPCQHCDQVFTNLNTRMSHTRYRHSALPTHVCRACGERFATFHRRAQHMLAAHGLPGGYPCARCGRTFVAHKSRRRHVQLGLCMLQPSGSKVDHTESTEAKIDQLKVTEDNNGQLEYSECKSIRSGSEQVTGEDNNQKELAEDNLIIPEYLSEDTNHLDQGEDKIDTSEFIDKNNSSNDMYNQEDVDVAVERAGYTDDGSGRVSDVDSDFHEGKYKIEMLESDMSE